MNQHPSNQIDEGQEWEKLLNGKHQIISKILRPWKPPFWFEKEGGGGEGGKTVISDVNMLCRNFLHSQLRHFQQRARLAKRIRTYQMNPPPSLSETSFSVNFSREGKKMRRHSRSTLARPKYQSNLNVFYSLPGPEPSVLSSLRDTTC